MRRFSAIIFLLCTFALAMSAQHIQRNYHDRSMSDVLIDLDKASKRYKISFIYNELEDFTVTQNVKTANIPDAIRKVIGFYPMQMTVGDSLITVECIRKERAQADRQTDRQSQSSCRIRQYPAAQPEGFLLSLWRREQRQWRFRHPLPAEAGPHEGFVRRLQDDLQAGTYCPHRKCEDAGECLSTGQGGSKGQAAY